jgi:hypothetical protein
MKRVIRSDKPITSVFPVKSQKCDFGAEPRCRLFVTSTGQGLIANSPKHFFPILTCYKFSNSKYLLTHDLLTHEYASYIFFSYSQIFANSFDS